MNTSKYGAVNELARRVLVALSKENPDLEAIRESLRPLISDPGATARFEILANEHREKSNAAWDSDADKLITEINSTLQK